MRAPSLTDDPSQTKSEQSRQPRTGGTDGPFRLSLRVANFAQA
jgi:hypothetical protein